MSLLSVLVDVNKAGNSHSREIHLEVLTESLSMMLDAGARRYCYKFTAPVRADHQRTAERRSPEANPRWTAARPGPMHGRTSV